MWGFAQLWDWVLDVADAARVGLSRRGVQLAAAAVAVVAVAALGWWALSGGDSAGGGGAAVSTVDDRECELLLAPVRERVAGSDAPRGNPYGWLEELHLRASEVCDPQVYEEFFGSVVGPWLERWSPPSTEPPQMTPTEHPAG